METHWSDRRWQLLLVETKIACPSVKNKKRSAFEIRNPTPPFFFFVPSAPKIVSPWIYFCRSRSTRRLSQRQILFFLFSFVLVWVIPLQFNLRRLNLRNNREPQETHIVLTFYPASFFLISSSLFPLNCFEHGCRCLCCWLLSLLSIAAGKVSFLVPLAEQKRKRRKMICHTGFVLRESIIRPLPLLSYSLTIYPNSIHFQPQDINVVEW